MAFYTHAAEGRKGFEELGVQAYHDECCPEEIKHFERKYDTWWQAPGWLWAPWLAGYICRACDKPC